MGEPCRRSEFWGIRRTFLCPELRLGKQAKRDSGELGARGIPILYLIAGDEIHVLARTISKYGLSVFNDHSDVPTDVVACHQTDSFNVQEVRDVASSHRSECLDEVANSHLDGFVRDGFVRHTSTISDEDMLPFVPRESLQVKIVSRTLFVSLRRTDAWRMLFFYVHCTFVYSSKSFSIFRSTLKESRLATRCPRALC